MAKKVQKAKYKYLPLLIVLGAVLVGFLANQALYHIVPSSEPAMPPPHHVIPYVDGDVATQQVSNFYRQYINPNTKPEFRPRMIDGYGSKNLVFYDQYYQHGFDPIICSTVMPIKVTALLVSTGPVATVSAVAEYPDGTKSTIVTTVVLNGALQIDSITCPGDKGNLPPQ